MTQGDLSIWHFMRAARPPEEEAAYRQHYLADDVRQSRTIIYLGCAAMVALTLFDVPSVLAAPSLLTGVVLRSGMIVFGLVLAWYLQRAGSPRAIDVGAIAYATILSGGILVFHVLNEPAAVRIAMVVTLLIFATNLGFPVYPVLTLIPILTIVIGDAALFFLSGREDLEGQRSQILTIYVSSELMAVFASAHLHRSRYRAFVALRQVKTLSGLVPICSSCKKVRNDDGLYQAIEGYIQEHSDAEFSHGICPECMERIYPEAD